MSRQAGWWDNSRNVVGGCKPKSKACLNCWAARIAATQQTARGIKLHQGVTKWKRGRAVFNGNLTVLPLDHPAWTLPLTWKGRKHPVMGDGEPSLIFEVDMADLCIPGRPTWVLDRVVASYIGSAHIGLIQTKWPERLAEYFLSPVPDEVLRQRQRKLWLGFSAEDQDCFNERWPIVRPLSELGFIVYAVVAPMLGPITLPPDFLQYGDRVWVVIQGEYGEGWRPMDADWARAVRDQCKSAGVPLFVHHLADRTRPPADLFIRQFPSPRM
jgi:protein gp37